VELIAKQDMLNGIKKGDHFEAPDAILVALGFATLAEPVDPPTTPRRVTRRPVTPSTP
jgi:hypothetical protein